MTKIFNFIKKFPITCYGFSCFCIMSLLYAFSITYDYGWYALTLILLAAPFTFLAVSMEKFLFPEYFLHSTGGNESFIFFTVSFFIVIFLSFFLDLALSKTFSHLKNSKN